MCLASSDPGGPRRCSADARTAYQKVADQVTQLEHTSEELSAGIIGLDADHHYAAAMALPPDQRDEALANLTPRQVDALSQLRRTAIRPDVDAAFVDTAPLELTDATRDTSSKTYGDILVHRAHGTEPVHAQLIDPDIAVWRQPSRGDYAIAYRDADAYRTIVIASKYKTAITMIDRVPILTPLDQSPGGIDDLQQQAHRAKADTALQLATQAAYGRLPNPEAQQAFLAEHLTQARDEIVDAAATPLHDEIVDATIRHRDNQRRAAAHTAATTARHDALTAGKDPDTAYRTAYQQALGTPTRGGAHIPHFAHQLPAAGIDAATRELLQHSGIRTYGHTTKVDYTVIARRGNDLKAWGLHDVYGTLRTPSIKHVGAQHAAFLSRTLSNEERAALRTYTSGRHLGDGAYIAINDAYTGRTATPTAAVANTCTHLRSAFDKFARHNPTREPITVVRGTHVPTHWAGSRADFLATAFPIGAKIALAQVTSATTRTSTAGRFANHGGSGSYLMVIRTRDGLPVKAISANAGEDEVIVPPGTALRCVRVDDRGVEHQPTVYLVAEDLVAEAEADTVRAARAS